MTKIQNNLLERPEYFVLNFEFWSLDIVLDLGFWI